MPPRSIPSPPDADKDIPMDVVPNTFEIDDNGLKLSLTIIDTPGFGSNINSQGSIEKVVEYIEKQYDEILQEEARIKRNPKFQDNRVHCVLYFIQPTGHSLKEIDVEFMKRLSHCSNVIPVIAKSDSLTRQELAAFKKQIMDEIIQRKIHIYDFPIDPEHDDEETVEENAELRALLPFAVIGSEEEVNQGGRRVRCRKYPWGLVEGLFNNSVDNPQHCDFAKLRYCLLNSHLQDLKEITQDILYEKYRTEYLSKQTASTTLLQE